MFDSSIRSKANKSLGFCKKSPLTLFSWWHAALLFLISGCGASVGVVCISHDDCRGSLLCNAEKVCMPQGEVAAACSTSKPCQKRGLCKAWPAYKIPNIDYSTEPTAYKDNLKVCLEKGTCSISEPADRLKDSSELVGACVASAVTCERSEKCKIDGYCRYSEKTHQCVVGGCKLSNLCKLEGKCTASNGSCVATEKGCLNSDLCKRDGLCGCDAKKQVCVAKNKEHCSQSLVCQTGGLCGLKEGQCRPSSQADCERTDACKNKSACHYDGTSCIKLTDEICQTYKACKQSGLCKANKGKSACIASAIGDCRQSTDCKTKGHCTARDGRCRLAASADCVFTTGCSKSGLCSFRGGRCEALSRDDCQRSEKCREEGLCSPVGGACLAAKKSDCRNTIRCLNYGECTAGGGECRIGGRADCSQSKLCKNDGACSFDQERSEDGEEYLPMCIAKSSKDCSQSAACKKEGLCSYSKKEDRCLRLSDDDCARSNMCREEGQCLAIPNADEDADYSGIDGVECVSKSDRDEQLAEMRSSAEQEKAGEQWRVRLVQLHKSYGVPRLFRQAWGTMEKIATICRMASYANVRCDWSDLNNKNTALERLEFVCEMAVGLGEGERQLGIMEETFYLSSQVYKHCFSDARPGGY